MQGSQVQTGTVVAIHRYPVKSMMGEELDACEITAAGVVGDRAYALIDTANVKIGTAKVARKWSNLLAFSPRFVSEPRAGSPPPPVEVTFPDGTTASSDQPDIDKLLSQQFGFDITLSTQHPADLKLDYIGTTEPDAPVLEFPVPPTGFYDLSPLHLLTTGTIDHLRELYPEGNFDTRRFRPNIVVETPPGEKGFLENAWTGKSLTVGDDVGIRVFAPMIRCVMTTLAQGDLAADPGILKTAAKHNAANVGAAATVERGGMVRRGDMVRVVD
jgi:uncharacterized protein